MCLSSKTIITSSNTKIVIDYQWLMSDDVNEHVVLEDENSSQVT